MPVWADFKSQLFWILASFFFMVLLLERIFQMARLIFLFDAEVLNPFIMKTTFTSDLSVCVQHLGAAPLYPLFLLDF